MRAILAAAFLLLWLSSAAPEPGNGSLPAGSLHLRGGESYASLVEIESSRPSGDRETIAAPPAAKTGGQTSATTSAVAMQTPAPAASNPKPAPAPLPSASEAGAVPAVSLDAVCSALVTDAQQNDLPVAFFANLIWQESGLQDDAVSPKGALGIAQFMPAVAIESGLENPFDPLQALSASARLLHTLRDQFGNLGLVAAAYNAGAKRVAQWLERRRKLPRETRGYVVDVTGRSVEQWRRRPPDDGDLRFVRRLPCRGFPAFAELEQVQMQQATLQPGQRAQTDAPPSHKFKVAEKSQAPAHARRARLAERRHLRTLDHRSESIRSAGRERYRGKREAKMRIRRTRHLRA